MEVPGKVVRGICNVECPKKRGSSNLNYLDFSPNRNCWGPLLRRKRNAPGGMGGTRLGSWGPAEFGWVAHAALELGARGVWVLGGWHSAQELGARGFGWLARGTGAGPRSLDGWQDGWQDGWHAVVLDGWHAAQELGAHMELGWVSWGPAQSLDGWHAAQELGELGARGVWMGGTRLWSRAPAVLMHVPGTFNIDGLSAGWVTACTHTC